MAEAGGGVSLPFNNKVYIIRPDFSLIRDIERELGGIAPLHGRFSGGEWKVSELVTIVHMMLQAAGETIDFLLLGNMILQDGISRYLSSVSAFLKLVLHAR